MAKLFAQEVPEIYDGIVEVKAVARDPGSRAKIAVARATPPSIRSAPASACAARAFRPWWPNCRARRSTSFQWTQDVASFVVNALAPAEVAKVVLDEDAERIEVVVPDEQLSLAIGRRGQNVRLASQLTGWDIDILTEAEESERRQKEFEARTELFMAALDVDEVVGQLLASEGFRLGRGGRLCRSRRSGLDRGLRRGDGAGTSEPRPAIISSRIEAEHDAKRKSSWASPTISRRSRASPPR
jgi:N utilization substance protein A